MLLVDDDQSTAGDGKRTGDRYETRCHRDEAFLSAKKSEVITQLQQKINEIVNECRFENRLRVSIF